MRPRYEVVRSDSSGLILVSAEYDRHQSVPHAYPGVSLGFCLDALDAFHCGGFHGPVAAGSILALEPDQIHWDRTGAGRIRMVYIPEQLLAPLQFETPVLPDAVLWAAGERLFLEPEKEWPGFRDALLNRPWVKPGRRPPSRFAPLLVRLAGEAPDLGRLGAEAGLSSSAFLRQFRKEIGCTPAEYSRQARLARAAQSLEHGAELAPAAVDHEFFDQSHFTRHFHRVYSVPPGEFRARNSVQSLGTASELGSNQGDSDEEN